MTDDRSLAARYEEARRSLQRRGQDHVLRFWNELDDGQREGLLSEIDAIPWAALDDVMASHVLRKPASAIPHDLQPPKVFRKKPAPEQAAQYEQARQTGRAALRQGKVAAFTVAGGQGSRLGVDGPKGAVVVTPVGGRTLFQLFAEAVLAARRKYEADIPWYVMTSPANHEQTLTFFREHEYFGLPKNDVMFFSQGMLPAFDRQGRLLLERKDHLALAPDGHGGSLKALVTGGALNDMRRRGVEVISYFQVDNPLVQPFDPLFIGLHLSTGSEMSTKVTPKAIDEERVGHVCLRDGKVMVIEYSDFPADRLGEKLPDGSRKFDAANLAVHLLQVSFVERVIEHSSQLPFRRADKAVPYVDEQGVPQRPASPNAVKLETFVFDVLPLAANPLVLEVERAEEFSPVKNATGVDSLETAQRDLVARSCRWLEQAGVSVPRRADGAPDVTVVLSPLFALEAGEVAERKGEIPELRTGAELYLA